MKVSIIVACFDAAQTVESAVRSALAQTHADLEVIVVDDGSTDGSTAVIEGIDDPRVVLLQQASNTGPGPARNRALEAATGAWLTFLDADDLYHPERIERLVRVASEVGPDVVLGDEVAVWRDQPPAAEPLPPAEVRETLDLAGFLAADVVIQAFFSRALLERTGARQPALLAGEDTVFLARLMRDGARLKRLRGRTYAYRRAASSLTGAPEQRERALEALALMRSELRGPGVEASLDRLEQKHRRALYYRRLAVLVRGGHLFTAARHAVRSPRLLVGTPVRWVRARVLRFRAG